MSKYDDFDYRKAAREKFTDDNIYDFDDKPQVSQGDDPGAYVQVWVWIADDDIALAAKFEAMADKMQTTRRSRP